MRPQALFLVTLLTTIAFSSSLESQANRTPEFEPLFPVVKDGKWGLVNRTGRVVVAPRFDELGRQSGRVRGLAEDLAGVDAARIEAHVGRACRRASGQTVVRAS